MEKKQEVILKKIVIKIKDKELSLSLQEAKDLIGVLEEVTGKDRVVKEKDWVPYLPYVPHRPYQPYWYWDGSGPWVRDTKTAGGWSDGTTYIYGANSNSAAIAG